MRGLSGFLRERRPGAVGASSTAAELARLLLVCSASGLFLGWMGPFGTGAAPAPLRFGYWVSAVDLGGLLNWTVILVARRVPGLAGRPWAMAMSCAVMMTPPGAVLIWAWTRLFFGRFIADSSPLDYVLPVLGVSVAAAAVNVLARPREPAVGPATEAPPPAPPRFLQRLPDRLRGADLYAVEAEDHYLRVHTSKGSDLILCRLADAVVELDGIEGLQTHRSWWVARSAVVSAARSDGRALLTLSSGVEAPVSRSALPTLREKGWL